jgi:hypothetical protein
MNLQIEALQNLANEVLTRKPQPSFKEITEYNRLIRLWVGNLFSPRGTQPAKSRFQKPLIHVFIEFCFGNAGPTNPISNRGQAAPSWRLALVQLSRPPPPLPQSRHQSQSLHRSQHARCPGYFRRQAPSFRPWYSLSPPPFQMRSAKQCEIPS